MKTTYVALASVLVAISFAGASSAKAGAAEIPPTRECVTTVEGLIAEIPAPQDASDSEYRKSNRDFFTSLAESGCISNAKPLIKKVALTPRSESCLSATKSAGEFWKPYTVKFNSLDKSWKRFGAPKRRRINHIQNRIRQLREAGASRARINQLVRTRRAIGRKLNKFENGLQRRARLAIGPVRYESFLTLSELVSLRCLGTDDVFTRSEIPGPAEKLVARSFGAVMLPLVYLSDEPGGEIAVYRYFESLDLD